MSNPVLEEYDVKLGELKEAMGQFIDSATIGRAGRGSKIKSLDSRKLSMSISAQLKDFRSLSIRNDKEK